MNTAPVVLVGPPQDHFLIPSLAISILKAGLAKRGIHSKAVYASLLFNKIIGVQLLMELTDVIFYNLLLERIFAPSAYDDFDRVNLKGLEGDEPPDTLHKLCQLEGEFRENIPLKRYSDMESRCKIFIDKTVETIVSLRPRIIGFSNAFQPINALIALARRIKRHLPGSICVIGGANCDGVIGEEIASSMGIFDYVFQGEADFVFPEFCYNYLENNIRPKERVIHCKNPRNLDDLPIPDYSDFFEQCNIPVKDVLLPYENSRGCWWGKKKQCKFCGESKVTSGFRFKSPERLLHELLQLQEACPDIERFLAVDSVLPHSYFQRLLPKLKSSGFNRELIVCVKSTLTYKQLSQVKQAGIKSIFVGIESLSSRLLTLVNKGTDALTNLRLLRDCRELDIEVKWNLLVGLPGDRACDYEEHVRVLPLIQHFSPTHFRLFCLQRFSPYFEDAKANEVTEVKPIKDYHYAFPESVDVTRLAYYFEGKYPSESRERPEILAPLKHLLDRWQDRWMNEDVHELTVLKTDRDQCTVKDTRDCAKVPTEVIDKDEYALLKQCRSGLVREHIQSNGCLKRLLDLGYLIEVDGKILSIVCDLSEPERFISKINERTER